MPSVRGGPFRAMNQVGIQEKSATWQHKEPGRKNQDQNFDISHTPPGYRITGAFLRKEK